MNRFSRRAQRGQAAVEMAVTMIVMLPLIFYTLFLEDLLYYNLEWQEGIVVTAWDALPLDYTKPAPDPAGNAMRYNRKVYCDHTAAYDSFNKAYDCSSQIHHKAMTAHQCWLLPGGKDGQIKCSLDQSTGKYIEQSYAEMVTGLSSGGFNTGGLVSCTAQLAVSNWFIPNKVAGVLAGKDDMNQAGTSSGAAKTKFNGNGDATGGSTGAHGVSTSAATENVWVFGKAPGPQVGPVGGGAEVGDDEEPGDGSQATMDPGSNEDFFGVLHDPWAVNAADSISPNAAPAAMLNPLYLRVEHYYQMTGVEDGYKAAQNFADSLKGDSLLGDDATSEPSSGDYPAWPQVAYMKDDNSRRVMGFPASYASGYNDDRQGQAYSNRTDAYFGMPTTSW